MTAPPGTPPPLAGGRDGADALRPLLGTVLEALRTGARQRGGPLPAGGPEAVTARVRAALGDVLPDRGTGDHEALRTLVHTLAAGAADPADPLCAAHLHCPPLAVAAAADLAAAALNPSLDSWDQAPAASAVEALLTRALAAEFHPAAARPDALVTTGGTEANQLALLLARERHGPALTVLHGANAHHSVPRAAWLLGLPPARSIPTPTGTLHPADLADALATTTGPVLVTATAGTTDAGLVDPLPEIARLCDRHGRAELHVDAAYGGLLALSPRHRHRVAGLDRARSVTVDLHKLGWQPVAAGLLTVPDTALLAPLAHQADYLNATDDTDAGLPDLLGRSLRTTRRPDALKIAVTLRSLGRDGLVRLIDHTCALAHALARRLDAHPGFEVHAPPTISTVLFRPAHADDEQLAALRRTLLHQGRAVLGRARADGRLWLKATLLNPRTTPGDLDTLVALLEGSTHR
ncbi:pyridoxal phosphate-dependent decarboxylase family protein [Streptomyces subrutilus]|uniref:Amino acid decarboxylase n=1 Tax=Streptomyces subrutilus TaxID=36818 RepID=A0A5P2UU94_9ACTN|nr:aminotransferase class V-fold PLP-dependent enzyme [Streptomyces subrutilus]QEU81071.1 aminotransferase class V-fold PLP-dependent enzyme [Streptomyces subrutilus]WSJ29617.1 aminotransferase class V-fold PLP-dependent enzyme [Streptomyces subrutilus]GGZ65958.1 amino acid decarboxylase [Streptomyces subrutilus]